MQRLRVAENLINFCNSLCNVGPSVEVRIILLCVCKDFNSETINKFGVILVPCFNFTIFTLVLDKAYLQLLSFTKLEVSANSNISWVVKAPTSV